MLKENLKEIAACALGVIVGAGLTYQLWGNDHASESTHPIANPYDTEYHVHADFLIYLDDQQLDLSADEYMTTVHQELSDEVHLHDNNGDVEHIHEEDVTFVDFLHTLGLTVTSECFITKDGSEYCADEENTIRLYVNGEDKTDSLITYVPVDEDQILLYYGDPSSSQIEAYLDAIPADSCYYSGTCPERGIAPPESCGLTCEL